MYLLYLEESESANDPGNRYFVWNSLAGGGLASAPGTTVPVAIAPCPRPSSIPASRWASAAALAARY